MNIIVFLTIYITTLRTKIRRKLLLNYIPNRVCNWYFNFHHAGREEIKILNLTWFDEENITLKKLLRDGIKSFIYPPNFLGSSPVIESNISPSVFYVQYQNARIQITSSSVVVNDEKIVIERAQIHERAILDYSQPPVLIHDQRNAVIRKPNAENIVQGIFLGGNGSSNYYHWLIELVVKLEFITLLPSYLQDYPLLISEDVFQIKSFEEVLELYMNKLTIRPRIKVLKKLCSYVVNDLVYINSPNSLPFNLFGDGEYKASYVAFDNRSINFLRNSALTEAFNGLSQDCKYKKIFIYRNNSRRKYNQDEVFTYLEAYGFTKVNMSDLSFLDQVRIFHNAECIVGPTGAEWTNLVFARKGTRALCWMPQEAGNFSAFSTISGIVNVDLKYITYKAGSAGSKFIYSHKYCIDLNMVKLGLNELGVCNSEAIDS